jgi:hypothetical protein
MQIFLPQRATWEAVQQTKKQKGENMTDFKVGDKVTWTSQAGGITKTKTGKVWAVLIDTQALWNARQSAVEQNRHTIMFDGYTMLAPKMYIVEVKTTQKAKPRLYLPRPKNLKRVEKC